MNKILRGNRYNTDTATRIAVSGDESLYIKRTGEFFLHAKSSPEAEWIRPITEAEARSFCRKNAEKSVYDKYFGEVPNRTVAMTVRLSAANVKKVKTYALERRITVSEAMNRIIEFM